MPTHREFVKELLKKPAVQAAYEAQAEEFALLDEVLLAGLRVGGNEAKVREANPSDD